MKQYVILGLVALGLFAVSAALSVWLNRAHTPAEEKPPGEAAAAKKGGPKEAEPGEKGPAPRPVSKSDAHDPSPAGDTAALRGREERLERRQAQTDLILRDLQSEREAVDALMRQVTAEVKEAATRPPEPEPKAAGPKKDADAEAAERKNIDQLARLYDAMAADSAAPILKQMADSGRLDTAVRILAQMKERQAAQVLAAMSDPSLAAQITEKVRQMRRAAPAGGAAVLPPPAAVGPSPVRGTP
ncbi:MAG: hypothetical protein JWO38_6417 [Gemmataceae bacterium]|nr:hypothetical protein [Gemmataceae bacterium]